MELAHAFGAHAGQRGDRSQFAGDLALEVIERRKMAGPDDFGELARQILADAWQRR